MKLNQKQQHFSRQYPVDLNSAGLVKGWIHYGQGPLAGAPNDNR
jgi:hypothetical protein